MSWKHILLKTDTSCVPLSSHMYQSACVCLSIYNGPLGLALAWCLPIIYLVIGFMWVIGRVLQSSRQSRFNHYSFRDMHMQMFSIFSLNYKVEARGVVEAISFAKSNSMCQQSASVGGCLFLNRTP